MQNWNIVANIPEHHYREAMQRLGGFGRVHKTDFYNVLVLETAAPREVLTQICQQAREDTRLAASLSRLVPIDRGFTFQSPEEFETKAQEAVAPWLERLVHKRFHVRMHRRGFKGRLNSQNEERLLDHYLIAQLEARGLRAEVGFDNPDIVIALETVGQRAGVSLWTREELERYPLVKLD